MILGGFLGRLQSAARLNGVIDPFGRIVQTAINPPARIMTNTANAWSDFFAGFFSARHLVEENRRLREQVAAANLYVETMDRLNQEIDSLRKLQGFAAIEGKDRIPASVIGFFPGENRLTLDCGANQGVRVGQPVLTPDGLLGRIQVATTTTSQVLLLSSPELGNRLGALVMRHPPSAGLLRGEGGPTFVLDFSDPKAPVSTGDLVVTSGFSEHIPRGIPIGRVIQVDDNEEFGKRSARVYPTASLGSIREVFVLK